MFPLFPVVVFKFSLLYYLFLFVFPRSSLYTYIFLKFVYFLFLLVFSLLYFDCVFLDYFNHAFNAQIMIEADNT